MDIGYTKQTTPGGNEYEVHDTHKGSGLGKNKLIAEYLVDVLKKNVMLLPDNTRSKELWEEIMPKGTKQWKHPDALVDNEIWEFKTIQSGSINALKRNISDAYEQADNVFVRFDHPISVKELYRYVKGEIMATQTLNKVWIWTNGKLIKFNRKEIKKPRKN